MRAPHPAGARIVKLDERLARINVGAHEWHEALAFTAPPAGALASDARAEKGSTVLAHAAARPWAPAHLRARRQPGGDVAISWVRCARVGGDAWEAGEPSTGVPGEAYRLAVFDGPAVKRAVDTASAGYLYPAADQIADFGSLPASLRLWVAQLDASGAPGLNKELTITL
jgi:hypothetical protein